MFLNVYIRFVRLLNTINLDLAPGFVRHHVACMCAMFHVTSGALVFVCVFSPDHKTINAHPVLDEKNWPH